LDWPWLRFEPFSKADRSRFLQALDEALVKLARGKG